MRRGLTFIINFSPLYLGSKLKSILSKALSFVDFTKYKFNKNQLITAIIEHNSGRLSDLVPNTSCSGFTKFIKPEKPRGVGLAAWLLHTENLYKCTVCSTLRLKICFMVINQKHLV